MPDCNRRHFAIGAVLAGASSLAGCTGTDRSSPFAGNIFSEGLFGGGGDRSGLGNTVGRGDYAQVYGRIDGERFPVAPFQYQNVDPAFLRQQVAYSGREQPGTLIVDPKSRFLYLVEGGGRATRYGVGVGREGFA